MVTIFPWAKEIPLICRSLSVGLQPGIQTHYDLQVPPSSPELRTCKVNTTEWRFIHLQLHHALRTVVCVSTWKHILHYLLDPSLPQRTIENLHIYLEVHISQCRWASALCHIHPSGKRFNTAKDQSLFTSMFIMGSGGTDPRWPRGWGKVLGEGGKESFGRLNTSFKQPGYSLKQKKKNPKLHMEPQKTLNS
jgi:hypothetical protein